MNRPMRSLAAVILLVTCPASAGAASPMAQAAGTARTPLWILHAQRYPGSLSQGVAAYASLARSRTVPRPPATAGPSAPVAGLDNVRANAPSSLPQNETAVAFDVFRPLHAVAASNDYQSGGLWIGHTVNGGQSWKSLFRAPRFPGGAKCSGSDPSVVFSRRDRAFYVSTLCFVGSRSQVNVWKSTDDGGSWTPAAKAAVPVTNIAPNGSANSHLFFDKELLAVDNTPTSPHFGRLYVTYIRFHLLSPGGTSDTCPVNLAYTDRVPTKNPARASWRHTAVVGQQLGGSGTGASANQWATPVVEASGALDIAYVNESCNSGLDAGLFFKRSTNGGHTFHARVRIDKPGQFADNPNGDDTLPHKKARIGISPSLTVNPVTGSLDYVFQNNENAATSGADISFVQSTDHGATWSDARTLSVDGLGDPAPEDQFFPWIAADKLGPQGTLEAIWLDNRNDPNDVLIETFQATSTDDGQTWTFQDISTASWNPNRSFFGSGTFIGDYTGVAASTKVVYPVWTDGRNTPGPPNGDTDVFTNVEIPGP
jgi:hypothetical protein